MMSPVASTRRSPSLLTREPAKGDDTNRMSAKADTTAVAANAETPNDSAKIGMDGMTMPKPSATKNAMEARTPTSRGRSETKGTLMLSGAAPCARARNR